VTAKLLAWLCLAFIDSIG